MVAVEFALVFPAFLIIVFGMIDGGLYIWTKTSLRKSIDDAARYAMVNQTLSDADLVTASVARAVSTYNALDVPGGTFTATVGSNVDTGLRDITIQANHTHEFFFPIFSSSINISEISKTDLPTWN